MPKTQNGIPAGYRMRGYMKLNPGDLFIVEPDSMPMVWNSMERSLVAYVSVERIPEETKEVHPLGWKPKQ